MIVKQNKGIKNIYRRWFYRRIIKKFLSNCNTIIDIGAGSGLFYDEAVKLGKDIIGIELEDKLIRDNIIKQRFQDISKKYDCFWNSQFIEHINPFELMDIVKKHCKKKIVTITTKPCNAFWNTAEHIRPYTTKAIERLYLQYGFKTIYSKYLFPTKSFIVIGERNGNL